MARVQITSLSITSGGRIGPFADGTDLYVVGRSSLDGTVIRVRRSTDGGATWSTFLDFGTSAGAISAYDCVHDVSGRAVYIAVSKQGGTARVLKLDIAGSSLTDFITGGTGPSGMVADANSVIQVKLARRSTGELVFAYMKTHSLMGNPWRAVYHQRISSAGAWQTAVETSAAVKTYHYDLKGAVTGTSDSIVFVYAISNGLISVYSRNLPTTNTLTAEYVVISNTDWSTYRYSLEFLPVPGGNQCDFAAAYHGLGTATWTADTNPPYAMASPDSLDGACTQGLYYNTDDSKVYCIYRGVTGDVRYATASGWTWTAGGALSIAAIDPQVISATSAGFIYADAAANVWFDQISTATAIGSSRSMPYNLTAPLGTSRTQPYIVRTAIGSSRTQPYLVRTVIGSSRSLPYNVRFALGASRSMPYLVAGAVGASRSLPYNVRVAVGGSRALVYQVTVLIGGSRASPYIVRVTSGASRTLPYLVIQAIGSSRSLPYKVLVTAGGSRTQPYLVRIAVGSSRTQPYLVAQEIGSSRTMPYSVASAQISVGSSRSLPYTVLLAVGSSRTQPYLVTSTAGASRSLPYLVASVVGDSRSLPYKLAGIVGASRTLPYLVTVALGSSRTLPYAVTVALGTSRTQPYLVLVALGASRSQPYIVHVALGSSRSLPYGVAGVLGVSRALPYTVTITSGASRSLPYLVAILAGTSRSTPFSVWALAGASRTMPYAVAQTAGGSRTLPYLVRATVGASDQQPYMVRVASGSSRTLPYAVTTSLGTSRSLPYSVNLAVGSSRTLPYLLSILAGTSRTLPYEVIAFVGASRSMPYQVFVPQRLEPIDDVTTGGWQPSEGTTLFGTIDEPVADDDDFDFSSLSPAVADVMEVQVAAGTDPGGSDDGADHRVRYRIGKEGGETIDMVVRLVQGTTVIASWSHANVSDTPTDYAQALTDAQANAITDYADLRVRVEAVKV